MHYNVAKEKIMEIKVIASTQEGAQVPKEEANIFAGHMAGVCYLKDNIDTLLNEEQEKTLRRVNRIQESGHHSPFDHFLITMELVDVPKIIAMMLNNEKAYTTSEKSARYRKMELPEDEKKMYDKWLEIFEKEIKDRYQQGCPGLFTDDRITKLAQENARYLSSIFVPTTMTHTVSYRQFNILYSLFKKEAELIKNETDPFYIRLKTEIDNLLKKFEEIPYLNEKLFDQKQRNLSLFDHRTNRPIISQYGDVYKIKYEGTFAQLAQAQRHRTLDYQLRLPQTKKFYVPPILKSNEVLTNAWIEDCKKLANNYPQGMLVEIIESGKIENLIMKAKERKCTMAQLEIDNQTTASIEEIYNELKKQNHPAAEDLKPYNVKSSRCTFPDYKCPNQPPCGFKEGIQGERLI